MRARAWAKSFVRSVMHRYVVARYHFGPEQLGLFLNRLGLQHGDTVMLHGSYAAFEAFAGKPSDVINVVTRAIGGGGTLLMPSMPFSGTAVQYVEGKREFDLRRLPSRMGLISEIFRRTAGVSRSTHPTHPVLCCGESADAICGEHHRASTPCGEFSPFARLLDRNGKILFLGADIESMTFFHYLEESLEEAMPFTPFTREWYELGTIGLDGHRYTVHTRLFDPQVSRKRNIGRLGQELAEKGCWNEGTLGNMTGILLTARDVADCCQSLSRSGVFCYDI